MATPTSADAADIESLEYILRHCAAAAPAPWYPRKHAKLAGIPLPELTVDVEFLWLEGLLRPARGPGDSVPGLTLTEAGAHALANPAELAALCHGTHAARARDSAARRALRQAGAPVVSRCLLLVNLIVFGAGIFIATGRGAAQNFLAGRSTQVVVDVLHYTGSISADDLVAGRWWRLLTAAFVHAGLLHLLMNMSMLAFGFGLAEAMWGRVRYLLIYLIAALGGNCVAMAWQPSVAIHVPGGPAVEVSQPVVGASGALCGVLAAIVVWVAFNGRHLPRAAAISLRTSLIASTVLLVFISLFPQVSGLCHLGGAIFGAAAAALLHIHRWNTGTWRLATMAGLVALPWLGMRAIDRQRTVDPRWHKAERRVFEQQYKVRIAEVTREAARQYSRHIGPLLEEPPRKRIAGQTQRALASVAERRPALLALASDLARAGPYHDAEAERERQAAYQEATDLAAKFASAEDVLQQNVNTPEQDEIEEREFSRQFLSRIQETMRRAITLYRERVQSLLKTPPRQRERAAVDDLLQEVESLERELADLTVALGEAGPYGNQQVESARQTAERYAAARTALLQAATRCLRAGDKWTPDEEEALQKQANDTAALRAEWEKQLEPR